MGFNSAFKGLSWSITEMHGQQNIKIMCVKITSFLQLLCILSSSQNDPEEACAISLLNVWKYTKVSVVSNKICIFSNILLGTGGSHHPTLNVFENICHLIMFRKIFS